MRLGPWVGKRQQQLRFMQGQSTFRAEGEQIRVRKKTKQMCLLVLTNSPLRLYSDPREVIISLVGVDFENRLIYLLIKHSGSYCRVC